MKLSELALALEAELRPASHADLEVHAVASPRTAIAGKGMLVFAEDEASLQAALASQAAAILTRPTLAGDAIPARPLLLMRHPKLAFARAARLLQPPPPYTGVDSSASVHPTAQLGREVSVGPCAVIGAYTILGDRTRIEAGAVLGEGVRIGADCRIHPRAVLYPGVTLGDRVIVHAGAVLGADGFGYVRDNATGTYIQFPQQGTLVLEDDVEIGANTTIDRGALEETRIERGTKIDSCISATTCASAPMWSSRRKPEFRAPAALVQGPWWAARSVWATTHLSEKASSSARRAAFCRTNICEVQVLCFGALPPNL